MPGFYQPFTLEVQQLPNKVPGLSDDSLSYQLGQAVWSTWAVSGIQLQQTTTKINMPVDARAGIRLHDVDETKLVFVCMMFA